jgi:predicted DNA-binding protein (MmcQ/YjbR family)
MHPKAAPLPQLKAQVEGSHALVTGSLSNRQQKEIMGAKS